MQITGKHKGVALLLAVIAGYWTWAYTYREDGSRFWASNGILLGAFVFSVQRSLKASIEHGGENFIISYSVFFLVLALIWLTAIGQAMMRPRRWYKEY